ncbi:hypothetical protein GETHPA_19090 [Geothrix rubra]|uniref:Uncharacterized protein n=1 Tax=Geothrix rubra TaxID=2927977 RepID=A0ABQ5Q7S6_9BACT|nr:hypothetical protein GETHPA_19090 [Geothrix rubra]
MAEFGKVVRKDPSHTPSANDSNRGMSHIFFPRVDGRVARIGGDISAPAAGTSG